MADTIVRLGNVAPTNSFKTEVPEEESVAAGPLGSKEVHPDGTEKFYKIVQEPIDGPQITTCIIPAAYSTLDALRDIHLAFSSQHSLAAPEWVHAEGSPEIAALLADHMGARYGVGEIPTLSDEDIQSLLGPQADDENELPPIAGGAIMSIGRDLWAQALGDTSSFTGTATSIGNTSLGMTGAGWTTNQWAGKDVTIGGVIGTVISNVAASLTIARWETPGSRSGSAASNPSTGVFVIGSGQCPAYWMATTANATAPSSGDTTLTAEITTGGSGFLRAVPVWAHTTSATTYTLTITYTATGSDSFPQNLNKIGVFNAQNGGRMLFQSPLSAQFTANQAGDNVTITDTVTGS